jgi:hypothetical protein
MRLRILSGKEPKNVSERDAYDLGPEFYRKAGIMKLDDEMLKAQGTYEGTKWFSIGWEHPP